MRASLPQRFEKSQKYNILRALKHSGALSVHDLLKKVNLSYMGVKQHCIELERDGFLNKKRRAKLTGRGRPEQAYELTSNAENLFPQHVNVLTKEIIFALRQLYGTNAPEKILFTIQQNRIQSYREKISSMLLEDRIHDFIKLREKDGYFVDFEGRKDGFTIREHHSPLQSLCQEFPFIMAFELQLYQKVLHPKAHRNEHQKIPYKASYSIPRA